MDRDHRELLQEPGFKACFIVPVHSAERTTFSQNRRITLPTMILPPFPAFSFLTEGIVVET